MGIGMGGVGMGIGDMDGDRGGYMGRDRDGDRHLG